MERNAAGFASLRVNRCGEALSSTIAMRVVAGYSVRTYRRNASSSPRRTICASPMPLSSLIGRMSTRAAISPPHEVNHDSLGHQRGT